MKYHYQAKEVSLKSEQVAQNIEAILNNFATGDYSLFDTIVTADRIVLVARREHIPKPELDLKNLLERPVTHLELSVRPTNMLSNIGITTIRELVTKSEVELLKYRNLGRKSINEIKERLKELDLEFGMRFPT